MERNKMLEKVQALLEKTTENGCTEAEAKSAMLMAQKIMAKCSISEEDVKSGKAKPEEIVFVTLKSKNNNRYRIGLASIIAKNFRCEVFLSGTNLIYVGHKADAEVAKQIFEYAFDTVQRIGGALYWERKKVGQPSAGVFPAYAEGFNYGLKAAFDKQCKALMIVVPDDVTAAKNEVIKGSTKKVSASQNIKPSFADCLAKGFKDGNEFMSKKTALAGAK